MGDPGFISFSVSEGAGCWVGWPCSEVVSKGKQRKGLPPSVHTLAFEVWLVPHKQPVCPRLVLRDEICSAPHSCRDTLLSTGMGNDLSKFPLRNGEMQWLAQRPSSSWPSEQSKSWILPSSKHLTKFKKWLFFLKGQNCWSNLLWSFCSSAVFPPCGFLLTPYKLTQGKLSVMHIYSNSLKKWAALRNTRKKQF